MKRAVALGLLTVLLSASIPALGKIYRQGDPEKKQIAITVDDCKNPDVLKEMLDLFQAEGIHATFFPIGRCIQEKDGDLWRRMVKEGHEIGNHTYGHASLTKLKGPEVKKQMKKMEEALQAALGFAYPVTLMRPPYGLCRSNKTFFKLQDAGYDDVILWSVSQTNPVQAMKQIQNGSICLFHSNKRDLRCLQEILPQLKAEGYEMGTVSELLGLEKVAFTIPDTATEAPQTSATCAPPP